MALTYMESSSTEYVSMYVTGRLAADAANTMAAITSAVAEGALTPGEGAEVAKVVDTYVRTLEASDFDRRLKALEAAYAADA